MKKLLILPLIWQTGSKHIRCTTADTVLCIVLPTMLFVTSQHTFGSCFFSFLLFWSLRENSLVISFYSKPIKIITIIHHMHFCSGFRHYINMCAHDASFEFYTRLSFRSNWYMCLSAPACHKKAYKWKDN